jgi:exosome complex RNA-binding protein Csl4
MIADHNTFVGFEDGQFKIGDIVEAQLLPNGKVRII